MVGIGSYAFRYAVGVPGFMPEKPMDIYEFAYTAKKLGYDSIQICDNLKYDKKTNDELKKIADSISEFNLNIEIGMNGIEGNNIDRFLDICDIFHSKFLRIVVGGDKKDQSGLFALAESKIRSALPRAIHNDITLGIENHFDLTTDNIIRLINSINSPYVRAIYDTTNSIGFIENPKDTLSKLNNYMVSVHVKDCIMKKSEASYYMQGTVLGEGELNIQDIIENVLIHHPNIDIVLEMTTRRNNDEDIETVIKKERLMVEQSTVYLKNIIEKLMKNEGDKNE